MTDTQTPPTEPSASEVPRVPMSFSAKLKVAGGVFLLFFVIPYAGLAYLWRDRCKQTSLAETRSPDGTYVVEQVLTDCGKTMAIASELKLKHLRDPTASVSGGKVILLLPAKDKIKVIWNDPHNLQINLPPQADIAKALQEYDGISINLVGDRVHRELPF